MVERLPVKEMVVGSSPTRGAICYNKYMPSDWPKSNSPEQPIELKLSQLSDEQILAMEALDRKETGRGNYPGRIPDWERFARIVLKNPNIKISNPEAFDKEFSTRLGEIALGIIENELLKDTE